MAYDPFDPNNQRTPLTGSFNEQPQAPMQMPNPMLSGTAGTGATQLASYNGIGNAAGLQSQFGGLAPLPAPAAIPGMSYDPYRGGMTLGGNPDLEYGNPARAANQQLQMQAYGASQRGAPQIDMGATNMFATGTGNALGNANATNLLGVRQGLDMSSLANGPGVAAQYGAANKLMGMSNMPAGPSVAEQQLQMGGDQAMRQQMAMAAGARGGNAALALQNAGQNQGDIMGNLNGQLGVQRAQEDMANRQFAANTAQAAGGMYGQALGSQMGALGGSAGIFGGIAGNELGQANTNLGLTQTYGGLATDQARIQGGQNQLNDQTMLASQGMGYGMLENQRTAEGNANTGYQNNQLQRTAIQRDYQKALDLQKNDQSNDWWKMLAKGASAAAGATAGFFAGGPPGAVAGGVGGYKLADAATSSDVRAKKNIKPAGEEISNAFRSADQTASQLMGTPVAYPQPASAAFPDAPGYAYQYKNPNAPGAKPGEQYGPMAQDLEQTPAGASVVGEKDGRKFVDPGRLAMLDAAETAKQRKELDDLKAAIFSIQRGISGPQVAYPQLGTIGM